jgi:hypothetical protein
MGLITQIFGGVANGLASLVSAGGQAVAENSTTLDEKLKDTANLIQTATAPDISQNQVNAVEAASTNWFVSGWRPSIGWVCAFCLALFYAPQFSIAAYIFFKTYIATGAVIPYPANVDGIKEITYLLLGGMGMRTIEKITGRA